MAKVSKTRARKPIAEGHPGHGIGYNGTVISLNLPDPDGKTVRVELSDQEFIDWVCYAIYSVSGDMLEQSLLTGLDLVNKDGQSLVAARYPKKAPGAFR